MIMRNPLINKKLKLIILIIVISLVFTIKIGSFFYNEIVQTKELKQIAINNGLKNVSLSFGDKIPIPESEYVVQQITVESSNFDTLTFDEMYNVANAFDSIVGFVFDFSCNGDRYKIYPLTRSIYKNGSEIHDDYLNSEIHNSTEYSKSNTSFIVTNDLELAICWTVAIDSVKSNLKSPSSAQFPFSYGSNDVSITKLGNTYTVKSWVDATNSFNTKIRSNFVVTIEKNGTNFVSESCIIY